MNTVKFGNTGLKVSEFCLGILPMGPAQADLQQEECIKIISTAFKYGVNFFDTAEGYKTQSYLGKALEGKREQVIIATKSASKTYQDMKNSVEKSLQELNTDYIDIYHLHAARGSTEVFQERKGALQCLIDFKKQGIIKNVGISTHSVNVVEKSSSIDEIDVVFPLINSKGLGIIDGDKNDMLAAIQKCHLAGKGMYAMKILGGGNLLQDIEKQISDALSIEGIASAAIGVTSINELKYNLSLMGVAGLRTEELPDTTKTKQLFIFTWNCIGCGNCVETCPNYALSIQENVAVVDHNKCILCGYCSPECPKFAIRII